MADYITAMATTIQVSEKLLEELKNKKLFEKESHEEVIWNMMEDTTELSEETKRDIEAAREDFRKEKYRTLAQVKKKLGL